MSILEYWLLGIALAMDCFTVSIAVGIEEHRIIPLKMTLMALAFGIFQGGMTWLGFMGTTLFSSYIQSFDHWIAFALLAYLGGNMIWSSLHKKEGEEVTLLTYANIPTMAVATSIDALAVGISFACLSNMTNGVMLVPVCIIALCSLLFSIAGLGIGIYIGKKIHLPVEIVGGIILIIIGIKILIEHLS